MRVGVFFSPEKRLMMMRETKERERERKREKVAQQKRKSHPPKMAKSKNQKTQKFLLLPLFLLLHVLALHSCFAHTRATNRPSEIMGKKGTASKKKQLPGAAAAKTPSLPNKVSRDSYFFSFLFDDSFVVGLRCVLELSHLSAARTHQSSPSFFVTPSRILISSDDETKALTWRTFTTFISFRLSGRTRRRATKEA